MQRYQDSALEKIYADNKRGGGTGGSENAVMIRIFPGTIRSPVGKAFRVKLICGGKRKTDCPENV
jgi:hypothetical protein